jgi:hypothetical protein
LLAGDVDARSATQARPPRCSGAACPFDEATWARARGWALWKALNTLSGGRHSGDDGQAAARRFGWRYSPRQVIGRVIADHARSVGQ